MPAAAIAQRRAGVHSTLGAAAKKEVTKKGHDDVVRYVFSRACVNRTCSHQRRSGASPKSALLVSGGLLIFFGPARTREKSMRGYGQFCPVAKGAEVFAERWTPLVLRELLCGSTRFSDLHRGVPLMSRTLLSLRLKQLEDLGVVKRKTGAHGPEYHLTSAGKEFAPIVRHLGEWAQRWFRSKFGRTNSTSRC
jgi:DNA-binding HxlR family transcriptional regulator